MMQICSYETRIFDVDGTIYSGYSGNDLVEELIEMKIFS